MAGGWPRVGDDTDDILRALSGDEGGDSAQLEQERALPRGMAGVEPQSVGAAQSVAFDFPITAFMRIQKLVANSAALVDLVYVTNISVGTISLNISQKPVPMAAFARDAIGTQLEAAVWASPSVHPVVTVLNSTTQAITVSLGLFGRVALGARDLPRGAQAA